MASGEWWWSKTEKTSFFLNVEHTFHKETQQAFKRDTMVWKNTKKQSTSS